MDLSNTNEQKGTLRRNGLMNLGRGKGSLARTSLRIYHFFFHLRLQVTETIKDQIKKNNAPSQRLALKIY